MKHTGRWTYDTETQELRLHHEFRDGPFTATGDTVIKRDETVSALMAEARQRLAEMVSAAKAQAELERGDQTLH